MSEIRWFAVPSGVVRDAAGVATHGRLSVLVSPRLDAAASVDATVMKDWPSRLASLHFAVESSSEAGTMGGELVASEFVPGADTAIWREFFGPGRIHVETPSLPAYARPQVAATTEHAGKVVSGYASRAQHLAGVGGPMPPPPVEAFAAQFQDVVPPTPPQPRGRGMPPPDFHRFVAMLREHPAVMRALGLVFDLLVAEGDLSPPGAEPRIRVTSPDLATISPWTKYHYDGASFLPAGGELVRSGRVDLSGAAVLEQGADEDRSPWAVTTFDVDSAFRRLQQIAANPRALEARTADDPASADAQILPPLRSAGLVLLHRDREGVLDRRAAAGRARMDLETRDFDADDLVLGYRLDVKRQGAPWRSLHQRRATYKVNDRTIGRDVDEENHLKPFAVVRQGDDGRTDETADLRTDEVVARWQGWSLAVPRPQLLPSSGATPRRRAEPPLPFNFTWAFEPSERSLPSLRFGQTYRMRVRIVDAAGGGLTMGEIVANQGATEEIAYLRYEPVGPPRVGAMAPLGPGSSLLTLVVRSDPAAGLNIADVAAAIPGLGVTDDRTLLPPTITMELAEQHGVFDGADDEAMYRLALRAILEGRADVPEIDSAGGLPDPGSGGVLARALPTPGGLPQELNEERVWGGAWPVLRPKSVSVRGGSSAHEVIQWVDDDKLEVLLPPAAEAVVQLSSFLDADRVGEFEIRHWLENEPLAAASSGRHPMATPPLTLRCVHAVRAPLEPVRGGLVPRIRAPGETMAVLAASLQAHTASTGHVDIMASWSEWRDVPELGVPEQVKIASARHVQSITVERGQFMFHDVRHELGDTKHRRVEYSARATSRFRQYFPATDPDTVFVRESPLGAVDMPSTALPSPPVVTSTAPAFHWTNSPVMGAGLTVRIRRGNMVRVELARPWFVTGDDERLGVLVALDPNSVSESERPFLSWAGRDPLLPDTPPARFLGAGQVSGIAAEAVQTVALPEAGPSALARLVPFEVHFAEGRWYADIGIAPEPVTVHSPMIQLAVVRYQRHSLPNLERSAIVKTDILNLLGDRTLAVEREETGVRVTLSAESPPTLVQPRVEVMLESAGLVVSSPLTALDAGSSGVQSWQRAVGGTVSGTLNVPLPLLPVPVESGRRHRIIVREVERVPPDPAAAASEFGELASRVVFVDVVDLD